MMSFESWGYIFSQSLIKFWYSFINFIPGLIAAIILFIIGCLIAGLIGKAFAQLISLTKVDKVFEKHSVNSFWGRTGFNLTISKFVGGFIKWFIIIIFLIASLQIIGLNEVNSFIREAVIVYLPKVIISCLVLVVATVIADVAKKFIVGSARGAKISSANLLGGLAYYSIWIFALIIVLFEFGIAGTLIQTILTGFIASLAIAFGLSFGLGGKDAASRAIEKISKDLSKKE